MGVLPMKKLFPSFSKLRFGTTFILLSTILFGIIPVHAFAASPAPAVWASPEYAGFVESLIVPNDPAIQQKLRATAPIQDSPHFAQNLLSVYQTVTSLSFPDDTSETNLYGPDWMSASEIIQVNQGDCKNHAILLATLIEALYKNTYGNLPTDLVWVRGGLVQGGGGHVWVLLNIDEIASVSPDAFNMIRSSKPIKDETQVPVGAEPPWGKTPVWVKINFASLQDTWYAWFPPQSVLQFGTLYVELEATWGKPIGEFYYKKYPYIELHDRWNNFQYLRELSGTAPGSGSVQLSSVNWHYADSVSWFVTGLTPNGAITPRIQGAWGGLQLPDVKADSSGRAWSSFNVGTNILGPGHFIIIDKTANTFLMDDYSLQTAQSNPSGPFSMQLSSTNWHHGDIVSWTAAGASPNGAVAVRIQGTWGTLQLWDAVADSTGKAGYSFNVGTNIAGSGQLVLVDKVTGQSVQQGYAMQTQQQASSPTLRLSSNMWHYGETIAWSAEGLAPNSVIQVMIQGPWGTLRFWDVTSDSTGRAGFNFNVGTNIPSSGRFIIIDTSTNKMLSSDYVLAS